MSDNHLRFPSGISVRRYRQQAKAAVRAGEFDTYTKALNAYSAKETGSPWDLALTHIRSASSNTEQYRYIQIIRQYASEITGEKVNESLELTDHQLNYLSKDLWKARRKDPELTDEIAHIGSIATLHFASSSKSAKARNRNHPDFTEYFQHWLYATRGRYGAEDAAVQHLMQLFPQPEVSHIPQDCKHWLDQPRAPLMTRSDILQVMDEHPMLTHFGIGIYFDRTETREEREQKFQANRKSLADAVGECDRACRFLAHVNPRKTIDTGRTSYGYKHSVEQYMRALPDVENPYVANGSFIAAALFMGFEMSPDAPNVCFNFSRKSPIFEWERLKGQRYRMGEKSIAKYASLVAQLGIDPRLDE